MLLKRLPDGDPSAKFHLGHVNIILKQFQNDIGKKLANSNEEAGLSWYGETVVRTVAQLSSMQEKYDCYQVDYDEELDRHKSSIGTKSDSLDDFVKTPAIDYDVKISMGHSSSSLTPVLFTTWKAKWLHTKEILETLCTGVTDDILYLKLKECLQGAELNSAVQANTYEKAFERLCKKYEDPTKIASDHFGVLVPGLKLSNHQRFSKVALDYMWHQADSFAKEGVIPREFLSIYMVCDTMSPKALKAWRDHVMKSEKDHIRTHKQAKDLEDNPWKLGYVINQKSFNDWYESWALAESKRSNDGVPKKEEAGSSNPDQAEKVQGVRDEEAATVTVPGCLFHGESSEHGSAKCKKVGDMEITEYNELCGRRDFCRQCAQAIWSSAHMRVCPAKCGTCHRKHMSIRHKHAPPLRKPDPSKQGGRGGAKRPRTELSCESLGYDDAAAKAAKKAMMAKKHKAVNLLRKKKAAANKRGSKSAPAI